MIARLVPKPLVIASLLALTAALGCKEREKAAPAPSASIATPTPPPSASLAPSASAAKPEPRPEKLTLVFGGDVNLGRGAGKKILEDPAYDPFAKIRPVWADADMVFVNLECQLSDQGGETQSPSNHLVFTGPPGGAKVLSRAGVTAVSLANNHAWDYGKKALFETFEHLEQAGVAYAGARREPARPHKPTLLNVRGTRIALFAVTHIWNQGAINLHPGRHYVDWAAFDTLGRELRKARKENDLVIVSYHGGGEYVDVPMTWTREFVRAVMNAGADLFIGHHPHVPHGVGWFGTRPVFYSLGNLVFAMHSDYPWTGTSFLAKVTVSRDGVIEAEACPYHILGHIPMPFEGKTKEPRERAFVNHLRTLSLSVGGTTLGEPGEHSCVPLSPKRRAGADG